MNIRSFLQVEELAINAGGPGPGRRPEDGLSDPQPAKHEDSPWDDQGEMKPDHAQDFMRELGKTQHPKTTWKAPQRMPAEELWVGKEGHGKKELDAGGPGSGRKPNGLEKAKQRFGDFLEHREYQDKKPSKPPKPINENFPDEDEHDIDGNAIKAGGPGSGRHPEGGKQKPKPSEEYYEGLRRVDRSPDYDEEHGNVYHVLPQDRKKMEKLVYGGIMSSGTSEGAIKGWDSRGRGHALGKDGFLATHGFKMLSTRQKGIITFTKREPGVHHRIDLKSNDSGVGWRHVSSHAGTDIIKSRVHGKTEGSLNRFISSGKYARTNKVEGHKWDIEESRD